MGVWLSQTRLSLHCLTIYPLFAVNYQVFALVCVNEAVLMDKNHVETIAQKREYYFAQNFLCKSFTLEEIF